MQNVHRLRGRSYAWMGIPSYFLLGFYTIVEVRESENDWNSDHTEVAVDLASSTLFPTVCRPITDFLITLILDRVCNARIPHKHIQREKI